MKESLRLLQCILADDRVDLTFEEKDLKHFLFVADEFNRKKVKKNKT